MGEFDPLTSYVSDCTPPGSRSTTFAFLQGIMYVGLALGPEIAGGVLHFVPSSDVSTIFILNLASFVLNLVFILLLLPESVPQERLQAKTNRGTGISLEPNRLCQRPCGTLLSAAKEGVVKFFLPLSLFLPSRNPVSGVLNWNLTIFAFALIMYELSMVSHQPLCFSTPYEYLRACTRSNRCMRSTCLDGMQNR